MPAPQEILNLIERFAYKLYGLIADEIKIVEGKMYNNGDIYFGLTALVGVR